MCHFMTCSSNNLMAAPLVHCFVSYGPNLRCRCNFSCQLLLCPLWQRHLETDSVTFASSISEQSFRPMAGIIFKETIEMSLRFLSLKQRGGHSCIPYLIEVAQRNR
eukprot:TRINITY_DN12571_c0_g3_i4.p2 TRINITY_DN12571_c0_g3~~TRINITY_DN12571_c0_g3_i4.p2  ORF type:complete len:106 (-),score=8.98 TRINITY_DN12571_c0_g3_i4:205-522(-)